MGACRVQVEKTPSRQELLAELPPSHNRQSKKNVKKRWQCYCVCQNPMPLLLISPQPWGLCLQYLWATSLRPLSTLPLKQFVRFLLLFIHSLHSYTTVTLLLCPSLLQHFASVSDTIKTLPTKLAGDLTHTPLNTSIKGICEILIIFYIFITLLPHIKFISVLIITVLCSSFDWRVTFQ